MNSEVIYQSSKEEFQKGLKTQPRRSARTLNRTLTQTSGLLRPLPFRFFFALSLVLAWKYFFKMTSCILRFIYVIWIFLICRGIS